LDLLGPFGLTFALAGAAVVALPFLDAKDERARIALFAICILLTWRYVVWRFTDTLPRFELRLAACMLVDGRRPGLRRRAWQKGVRYLTGPDNSHAKAGNINHALNVLHDDLVRPNS
jgi:apolipoprotein N-acyltransferase